MPIETFQDPTRLDDDARREWRVLNAFDPAAYDQPPPRSISDRPRILTIPILHAGVFKIEAQNPTSHAHLHFSPEQPRSGHYEIRRLPRGVPEKGTTCAARAIDPDDLKNERFSMLRLFALRYAVATVAAARPHIKMMWLVGLNQLRDVAVEEDS